ncbi:hypothetical protein HF086_017329 [Spodoptera exigua]|uniref:E3 ubiquitin-protein ligase n=1 Tax=Spodoptera exigua TaxID=7107 RepID=A0A922S975_SPOEX|nr:hypothetical protein HF086_017329 [Spodoptera exigua]
MDLKEYSISDDSSSGFVWVHKISRTYLRLVSLCYNKKQGTESALMSSDDCKKSLNAKSMEEGRKRGSEQCSCDIVTMCDTCDRFTLPGRGDAVVELWRSKMEEGVLAPAHFLDHWRVTVPRIYSPQPNRTCLDWSFDEDLAAKLLIQPLEQFVITTLVRVTKCNQRDSLELVSLIDREGRALVKCNSFQVCDKLKTDIEIVALSLYEYHPVAPPGANIDELIVEAMIINMLPALRNESLKLQNFVSQEPSLRLAVSQVALGEEVWGASTSVGGGGGVACGGRLEFDRTHIPMAFKRAQFILYDVKYLLSSVPTSFDDDLRKGFMHGMSLMLNLLVMMQGMDSVVRQVGQHMEYEPEWESAFNLHVKLAHSITLSLEWCAAEKTLATACEATFETTMSFGSPELGNQSASVIPYDVSTEPVSIHRPLSRYIAGLHLLLHAHGLSYHSREASPANDGDDRSGARGHVATERVRPDQPTLLLPERQVSRGDARQRCCHATGLNKTSFILQIGASLIESNEFIIHVLNKFNLLEWAAPDFEQRSLEDDTLRHTISMLEEFLGLLITIYGSRYVPGVGEVTNEDRTMKEIIQMLCVKPMPHSELNRCLPEDQLHETGLEAVIHKVADFIKPTSGNNRGVYKLKPHLYDEYDTFFYHYTREELSRSEEEQRNRRKAAGLPECCPPPMLPKLAPPFRLLANLLQCDAVHHVLKTVLERALDLRARSFSETQVHKALHLIGYALRDEESGHYEFVQFAEGCARTGLAALLQQLAASPRLDAHRHLARWLHHKIRSLLGQTDEHIGDGENMDTDQEEKPTNDEAAGPRGPEGGAASAGGVRAAVERADAEAAVARRLAAGLGRSCVQQSRAARRLLEDVDNADKENRRSVPLTLTRTRREARRGAPPGCPPAWGYSRMCPAVATRCTPPAGGTTSTTYRTRRTAGLYHLL